MTPNPSSPPVFLQVHHIGMADGYVLRWRHRTNGTYEIAISPGTVGPLGSPVPYCFNPLTAADVERYLVLPPLFYPTRGFVSPAVSRVGY